MRTHTCIVEVDVDKGLQPDNARAEGFSEGLRQNSSTAGTGAVALDEFADMRISRRWSQMEDVIEGSDLGYKSPMQYRRDLGLIA